MSGIPSNRPGSGMLSLATCDECRKSTPLDKHRAAKVKSGPLKGLRGWVCVDCMAARVKVSS